jgi:hypothetical protein
MDAIQMEHTRRVGENVGAWADQAAAEAPTPIQVPAAGPGRSAVAAGQGIAMNRYYFQTLVALGTPAKLSVLCMTSALHSVTRGAAIVVVLALAVFAWRRSTSSGVTKFLATVCVAALLLAVRTLAGYSFADYLTDLIWLLGAVAVVLGVWRLVHEGGSRLAAWRKADHRSSEPMRPMPVLATAGASANARGERPTDDARSGEPDVPPGADAADTPEDGSGDESR